jgi:ParB family chromosome partitioning protein
VAGNAIGAAVFLPNMATDTFLPCLSRAALERAASAAGLRVEVRAKDTRARLIERFKSGTYVHPEAAFGLTADELAELDGERRIAADNDAQETGAAAADDPAASDLDGAGNDPADDDDPSLRDAVSDGLDAAAD